MGGMGCCSFTLCCCFSSLTPCLEADPSKGIAYLYLTKQDYETLNKTKPVVICQKTDVNGEERYVIQDVIGEKHGSFGVENLRGSGLIAGETSRAYNETFTISLVTCRTVGIGAYLVRYDILPTVCQWLGPVFKPIRTCASW